ncbi:MAG: hypothetical protein LRY71_10510 [Bacillaceae bacterium]|nr:hypothetical protein [Bacillaceae bacterium]
MWVRRQDKKELVKCFSFSITKNFGGKKRFAITGTCGGYGKTDVLLGLYDTNDAALNELTKIQEALTENKKRL